MSADRHLRPVPTVTLDPGKTPAQHLADDYTARAIRLRTRAVALRAQEDLAPVNHILADSAERQAARFEAQAAELRGGWLPPGWLNRPLADPDPDPGA